MNVKIALGCISVSAALAFWACADGEVITADASEEVALQQVLHNRVTVEEAIASCNGNEACVAEMTDAPAADAPDSPKDEGAPDNAESSASADNGSSLPGTNPGADNDPVVTPSSPSVTPVTPVTPGTSSASVTPASSASQGGGQSSASQGGGQSSASQGGGQSSASQGGGQSSASTPTTSSASQSSDPVAGAETTELTGTADTEVPCGNNIHLTSTCGSNNNSVIVCSGSFDKSIGSNSAGQYNPLQFTAGKGPIDQSYSTVCPTGEKMKCKINCW